MSSSHHIDQQISKDQHVLTQLPHTPDKPDNHNDTPFLKLLDRGDAIIYAIVGTSFFLGALVGLGYSFWNFYILLVGAFSLASTSSQAIAVGQAIIQFVSDLLLVLIIMEVLGTVTHYLKSHVTSLRPFLFIGIIS